MYLRMNNATFAFHKVLRRKKVFYIYSEKYDDFGNMMARYKEEMRRTYNSVPHFEGTGEPAAEKEDSSLEEKLPKNESIIEELKKDNSQEDFYYNGGAIDKESSDEDFEVNYKNNEDIADDSGKIIVTVNSGREAFPIEGVRVLIDKEGEDSKDGRFELVGVLVTDSSGRTNPVTVAAANRELSQSTEENGATFTTYYVSARKRGYFSIDKYPVDVFGGQTSILELGLVPKPEELGEESE